MFHDGHTRLVASVRARGVDRLGTLMLTFPTA
jgi:hypothetical protein